MSDLIRLVGEQLRLLRRRKGLTQSQLAERTGKDGFTKSRVSDIERGRINISLGTLGMLIDALDVTPNELFNFQELNGMDGIEEKRLIVDIHRQVLMDRSIEEVKYVVRHTQDFFHTVDTKIARELRKG